MAAWRYEFYLRVLKVSFILSALEDKIRIPARPCNILYIYSKEMLKTIHICRYLPGAPNDCRFSVTYLRFGEGNIG